MLSRFALSILALLTLCGARPALAAPAVAKHLPADTKWYIHLDAEAFRQTVLFQQVFDFAKVQLPLDEQLAALKQMIGVNPITDISGITIYNNSFDKDVAAILIYAKIDQGLLAGAVAQNPDYKEVDYNKHKLLTWTDANDGKKKAGCFYNADLILMADKPETVQLAIDVLDGVKPAGSALVKSPVKNSFLNASANLGLSNDQNASRLLSNTEAATASAGESNGVFNVTMNLVAKTAEQGAQIRQMVEGVKAMAALGAAETPTVGKLLQQVKVTADGPRLTAIFDHDSKDVIETLKKLDAEKKAKEAKAPQAPARDPNTPVPGGL